MRRTPGAGERRLQCGNQIGNHKQQILRRGVAHYGASSEGERGFSGESPELIMPGSPKRIVVTFPVTNELALAGAG